MPLRQRCVRHSWRFPGPRSLDPAICDNCHCEGVQWYDLLSGGVDRLRGRQPSTDLRHVYPALRPIRALYP